MDWRKRYDEKPLTLYCLGDQIEKNDIDGTRSTYGGEDETCIQDLGRETRKKETTLKTKAQMGEKH